MENMEGIEEHGSKEIQLSETKRVSRNMNEKRRRDRFNVLISELAAVVPQTSGSSGKFDKTTVLKKAIAFLRSHHDSSSSVVVSRPTTNWQPAFVSDSELNQLLLEAMDSFTLILDGSGIITFASDSILSILGYRPQDVLNNSIADYLDQTDQSCIFAHLASMLEQLKTSHLTSSNSPNSSLPVSKIFKFEMKIISGHQRIEIFSCSGQAFATCPQGWPSRTVRGERAEGPKLQLILVCNSSGPISNHMLPMSNVTSKEFTSRLTLDWKFTYSDTRVVDIVGYQPQELVSKSIYSFINKEDLANVASYHKMLESKGRVTTCYYRFLTKGEIWIWLRSCCYISYNQWNSKPENVTMTTTPVNYEEVYANQQLVVQSDKLQFQNIFKDLNSSKTLVVDNARQKSNNSPLSLSQSQACKDFNKSEADDVWESPAIQDNPMDDKTEQEKRSNQSEGSSHSKSVFSTIDAPGGLTPAQYNLHKQLQGKHILLEQSIEHQMIELQKIKGQIEINKKLWEFNRHLQEKKAEQMARNPSNSNSCNVSDKSSDLGSSYDPQSTNPGPMGGNNDMPANGSMYLNDMDSGMVHPNNSSSVNEPSQIFTPLQQPYNYYQY